MAEVDNDDAQIAALIEDVPVEAGATTDAAAPEAQDVRVVKEGDTLMAISQEVGVPLEQLARDNGITDVNVITPGQELKIVKPGAADTDISATPSPEGGSEVVFDSPASGKTEVNKYDEEGALITGDYSAGKYTAPGIDVSLEGGGDLSEVPAATGEEEVEPAISEAAQFAQGGKAEVQGVGEVALEPTAAPGEPTAGAITGTEKPAIAQGAAAPVAVEAEVEPVVDQKPDENEILKIIESVKPTDQPGSEVYDGVVENIKGIKHKSSSDAKEFYQQISDEATAAIKKIDDSIAEIAEEKIKPTFSGWNKFMALLGAAMGAYGSAMTGTPNYALQIMNKAIDADAEQFLASKEIRTKSLLQQRQEVLQRRADLLQIAINESDRMLKVAELQVKKEESVASVQAIKDGLEQEKEKTKAEIKLAAIKIITDRAAAKKVADAALSKDKLERGVPSVDVINGDGETVTIPGYLAPTPKEGAEQRLIRKQTKQINNLLTKMQDLYSNENNWGPGVINQSAVSLEQHQKELLLIVKNINKMGANFTVPEIEMITATIPTTDIAGKLNTGLIKIKNLRNKYISDEKATMESFGYTKMPNAAGKKKLGPGMKAGVSK